jgi:phospholipid transport system substrate-binding protein
MKSLRILLAALLATLATLSAAAELLPDALARKASEDVLAVINADKDIKSGNVQRLHQVVEEKVLPFFDFERMTKLAVGKHWSQATPAQQESLMREFRGMLVRTYANALLAVSSKNIDFKPLNMAPGATEAVVKTEIKQAGASPITIDFSTEKGAGGWKVYDVAIDEVSLVTNYRGSFNAVVRKNGIDGLIASLASGARKAPAPK